MGLLHALANDRLHCSLVEYFHEGLPLTRHVTAQYKSSSKRDDSASSAPKVGKHYFSPPPNKSENKVDFFEAQFGQQKQEHTYCATVALFATLNGPAKHPVDTTVLEKKAMGHNKYGVPFFLTHQIQTTKLSQLSIRDLSWSVCLYMHWLLPCM